MNLHQNDMMVRRCTRWDEQWLWLAHYSKSTWGHNWVPVLIHSQTWHIGGYSDEALDCSKVLTLNREAGSLLLLNNKVNSKVNSKMSPKLSIKYEQAERASEGTTSNSRDKNISQTDRRVSVHLLKAPCNIWTQVLAAGWASRKIFLSWNARPSLPFSNLKKTKGKKKTSSSLCAVPFTTHKVLVLSLVKYLD